MDAAREVQEDILAKASKRGFDDKCLFALRIGMEEAMINAHKHGNRFDQHKNITIEYDIRPDRVVIRIRDEGEGFDPAKIPDPTEAQRLSLPCGRGVLLMRSFMDDVRYGPRGNEVQLVKENA